MIDNAGVWSLRVKNKWGQSYDLPVFRWRALSKPESKEGGTQAEHGSLSVWSEFRGDEDRKMRQLEFVVLWHGEAGAAQRRSSRNLHKGQLRGTLNCAWIEWDSTRLGKRRWQDRSMSPRNGPAWESLLHHSLAGYSLGECSLSVGAVMNFRSQ